jgi:cyclophilin family peptidyl-prolyl cis-trans isomerase
MNVECPPSDGSAPKTQKFDGPPPMCLDLSKRYSAEIVTSKGSMIFALDAIGAPRTVNNFVVLARYHFYEDIFFHRVIPGFVVQGGDPTGTGTGGPGYRFEDELPAPGKYKLGSLAMANAGPDTNGSQFFVISGPSGSKLPPSYSLFGQLVKGEEVLKAIESVGSSDGTPRERVVIERVVITEND